MNKTEIVNFGLGALGVSYRVFDFDSENSNQAKIARQYLQRAIDTVVEANEWTFLRTIKPLALQANNVAGKLYQYGVPADCAVIRQIATEGHFLPEYLPEQCYPSWEFFNGEYSIVADVKKAYALYTRKVMQDDQLPSYFGRAVSAQFALDVAPALVMDKFTAIKARLEADLERDIGRAISYDSGKRKDNEVFKSSYELLLR